jgi:hypothetical protein
MASTVVAPRPSLNTPSTFASELVGLAMCPSCRTQDLSMTNLAVSAGADWQCSRCGSRWNTVRLATVAAYTAWASARMATSVNPATHPRGDV